MEQVESCTVVDEVAWPLRFVRSDGKAHQKAFPDHTTMKRFIDNEPDIVVLSAGTTTLTGDRSPWA